MGKRPYDELDFDQARCGALRRNGDRCRQASLRRMRGVSDTPRCKRHSGGGADARHARWRGAGYARFAPEALRELITTLSGDANPSDEIALLRAFNARLLEEGLADVTHAAKRMQGRLERAVAALDDDRASDARALVAGALDLVDDLRLDERTRREVRHNVQALSKAQEVKRRADEYWAKWLSPERWHALYVAIGRVLARHYAPGVVVTVALNEAVAAELLGLETSPYQDAPNLAPALAAGYGEAQAVAGRRLDDARTERHET